jgi:hypothetical protein
MDVNANIRARNSADNPEKDFLVPKPLDLFLELVKSRYLDILTSAR